jgi:predicted RNase H-like HicB family nuclease
MRKVMSDLIFEVTQEADGGFVAECLTEPIVTQGDSWESLREAVNEAVRGYFFDAPEKLPSRLRLHLVRDESFALA